MAWVSMALKDNNKYISQINNLLTVKSLYKVEWFGQVGPLWYACCNQASFSKVLYYDVRVLLYKYMIGDSKPVNTYWGVDQR